MGSLWSTALRGCLSHTEEVAVLNKGSGLFSAVQGAGEKGSSVLCARATCPATATDEGTDKYGFMGCEVRGEAEGRKQVVKVISAIR